jgi:hypothetical protein
MTKHLHRRWYLVERLVDQLAIVKHLVGEFERLRIGQARR